MTLNNAKHLLTPALAVAFIALSATATAQAQEDAELRAHAGYAFLDSPAGVDSQWAYFIDAEFVQQGGIFGLADLVFDLDFTQTRVSIGDDNAVQSLLQTRVGPGVHFDIDQNMQVYTNLKVSLGYEWLSVNGISQNGDGSTRHLFFRPELGVDVQESGFVWRATVFNDGSELAADRNGIGFAGQIHFDNPEDTFNWGVRATTSFDKTTIGVGFRL